jgi:hypothetical protein
MERALFTTSENDNEERGDRQGLRLKGAVGLSNFRSRPDTLFDQQRFQ